MTIIKLDAPALVLRTCDENLRSYWDPTFQWPESGPVSAPDWSPNPDCGNGLHGLLWGEKGATYLTFSPRSKWMVVEINQYVQATADKVKYPEGRVVFVGSQADATKYIHERAPQGTAVVGLSLTGGNRSTLTGGDDSTLTGGYGSTLTGGYGSTLTGGDDSTLTGGYGSTLTGGNRSTLTGGDDSTLTGGNRSTLTGGDDSTLTGGDDSTLTGGNRSTLTGGDDSTLTGGYGSTLTGGYGSTLLFKFWDAGSASYRRKMAETGHDGIVQGIAYKMNAAGVIVPA